MALTNKLKAIADAIRAKTGKSGALTLEQMVTEIASISGGGIPSGISKIDFGTYTVSSAFTTTAQTVPHNLGVTPDFVFFYAPSNISQTYSMLGAMRGTLAPWRSGYSYYYYHGNSSSTVMCATNGSYGITSMSSSSFNVNSHSTSYSWRAGTYNYIAIKFA